MAKATTRWFALVRLSIIRDIDDRRPRPNMHSTPHHLPRNPIQTTRLDTHSRSRFAIPRDRLVHQPRATPSTKEALRFPVAVRSRECCDCSWEWRFYFKRGKDGGHAVGGGALVAAFGAVTYEELLGCGEGGGEFDEAALASSFHCFRCIYERGRRFGL
jgi:hypothetical protein